MPVTITHSTLADGTFSATGAAAWDATHTVSGLGTMAEQNSNNVNITGGSITGVTGVLSSLTVNSTPTSGGAAGQIMFDTGSVLQESSNLVWDNTNGGLRVSSIANPTIPSLTLNGASNYTGSTLSGVQITGTAGQFSCNATTLTVGEFVTISGTLGGTGSISGYANPTTYRISATNGTTTFTLVNATSGAALTTSAGTPTGLTYTVTDPFINLSQTWNNSVVAFQGLRYNVTDTASNAASALVDLQVGGVSKASIKKNGDVITTSSFSASSDSYAGRYMWITGTSGYFTINGDTILSRKAAANWRFGAADAAAPVAQTLSVQSVVAGTSNTAGANLTITGSQGTGTGAGGSIIFQVAPAGSSGTAQNALATALTIAPTGLAGTYTFTGGTGSGTSTDTTRVTFNNISANSFKNQFDMSGAGAVKWAFGNDINGNKGDNFYIYSASGGAGGTVPFYIDGSTRQVGIFSGANVHVFGFWNNTSGISAGTLDVILSRRGAANLRFGNADAAAPVAQTLSVQSVVAGTSNTAGANLTITGSQGTGTGAGGSIIFQYAPAGVSGTAQNALATALTINGNNGNIEIATSNLWFGNGNVRFINSGSADGVFRITGTTGDFNRVQFGGTSSSFPALKRSTTILQVRLADDSGYTTMDAQHRLQGTAPASATATGTAGDIRYDADYIYICTATDTWKRVAIATWP